jgi:hypothetical protein
VWGGGEGSTEVAGCYARRTAAARGGARGDGRRRRGVTSGRESMSGKAGHVSNEIFYFRRPKYFRQRDEKKSPKVSSFDGPM